MSRYKKERIAVPRTAVMLRLPDDIYEACLAKATKEHRSLASQLVKVVEDWVAELEEKSSPVPVGAD